MAAYAMSLGLVAGASEAFDAPRGSHAGGGWKTKFTSWSEVYSTRLLIVGQSPRDPLVGFRHQREERTTHSLPPFPIPHGFPRIPRHDYLHRGEQQHEQGNPPDGFPPPRVRSVPTLDGRFRQRIVVPDHFPEHIGGCLFQLRIVVEGTDGGGDEALFHRKIIHDFTPASANSRRPSLPRRAGSGTSASRGFGGGTPSCRRV